MRLVGALLCLVGNAIRCTVGGSQVQSQACKIYFTPFFPNNADLIFFLLFKKMPLPDVPFTDEPALHFGIKKGGLYDSISAGVSCVCN